MILKINNPYSSEDNAFGMTMVDSTIPVEHTPRLKVFWNNFKTTSETAQSIKVIKTYQSIKECGYLRFKKGDLVVCYAPVNLITNNHNFKAFPLVNTEQGRVGVVLTSASTAVNNAVLVNWGNKISSVHCEYLLLLSELQDQNFVDKLVCRIHTKNLNIFLGLKQVIANFFNPFIDNIVLLNGLDLFKIYSNELKEDDFIPIFFTKQGTKFCKELYADNFEKTHNIDRFYNTRLFDYEPSKLLLTQKVSLSTCYTTSKISNELKIFKQLW